MERFQRGPIQKMGCSLSKTSCSYFVPGWAHDWAASCSWLGVGGRGGMGRAYAISRMLIITWPALLSIDMLPGSLLLSPTPVTSVVFLVLPLSIAHVQLHYSLSHLTFKYLLSEVALQTSVCHTVHMLSRTHTCMHTCV